MRPRALSNLTQVRASERLALISEGLDMIHRHVTTLIEGIDGLNGSQIAVVSQLAEEESAKALIMIDIVRAGRKDQKAVNRLTDAFYSHLARGIYADLVQMRPMNFGELHRLAESMRESHYLDGPNDVDWIFRNEVLQRRESALYVDLVEYEEGRSWDDPSARNSYGFGAHTPAAQLVLDLQTAGCFSIEGLREIERAWAGFVIDDETPWHEADARNREIFETVAPPDLPIEYRTVANWQFPLGGIDLTMKEIDVEELERKRENWDPEGYADAY